MKPRYCAPVKALVSSGLDGLGRPTAPVPAPRTLLYGIAGAVSARKPVPSSGLCPLSSTRRPVGPMPTCACGGFDWPLPGSVTTNVPGTLVILPKNVGPQAPRTGTEEEGCCAGDGPFPSAATSEGSLYCWMFWKVTVLPLVTMSTLPYAVSVFGFHTS